MKNKNYYEILGLTEKATSSQIKKSFYRLAKQYHPDINPKGANIFKEINEAYKVLSNPSKKQEYDNSLNDISEEELATIINDLADTLNKNNEELEKVFDYYDNSQYYQNPKKEPMFEILSNFTKYRFENAITSIWNRNLLAIFGMVFIYLISLCGIILTKPFWLYKKIKNVKFGFTWLTITLILIKENDFFKTLSKTLMLSVLGVFKVIVTVLYGLYWLFSRIFRYFLLPAAIIIATLMRIMFYTPSRR